MAVCMWSVLFLAPLRVGDSPPLSLGSSINTYIVAHDTVAIFYGIVCRLTMIYDYHTCLMTSNKHTMHI